MPFQCFDVDAWYFEEIPLDLKRVKKKWKQFIKHNECSDVLLAGVGVNVCGTAENDVGSQVFVIRWTINHPDGRRNSARLKERRSNL